MRATITVTSIEPAKAPYRYAVRASDLSVRPHRNLRRERTLVVKAVEKRTTGTGSRGGKATQRTHALEVVLSLADLAKIIDVATKARLIEVAVRSA